MASEGAASRRVSLGTLYFSIYYCCGCGGTQRGRQIISVGLAMSQGYQALPSVEAAKQGKQQ